MYLFRARTYRFLADPANQLLMEFATKYGIAVAPQTAPQLTNPHAVAALARQSLTLQALRSAREAGVHRLVDCFGSDRTLSLNYKLNGVLGDTNPFAAQVPDPMEVVVVGPAITPADIARRLSPGARELAPRFANDQSPQAYLLSDIYLTEVNGQTRALLPQDVAQLLLTCVPTNSGRPPVAFIIGHTFPGAYGVFGPGGWVRRMSPDGDVITHRPDPVTPSYDHPPVDWWVNNGSAGGLSWARVHSFGDYVLLRAEACTSQVQPLTPMLHSFLVTTEIPEVRADTGVIQAKLSSWLSGPSWFPSSWADAVYAKAESYGLVVPKVKALVDPRLILELRKIVAARTANNYLLRNVTEKILQFYTTDPVAVQIDRLFPGYLQGMETATAHYFFAEMAIREGAMHASFNDHYGLALSAHNQSLAQFGKAPGPARGAAPFLLAGGAVLTLLYQTAGWWYPILIRALARRVAPAAGF